MHIFVYYIERIHPARGGQLSDIPRSLHLDLSKVTLTHLSVLRISVGIAMVISEETLLRFVGITSCTTRNELNSRYLQKFMEE